MNINQLTAMKTKLENDLPRIQQLKNKFLTIHDLTSAHEIQMIIERKETWLKYYTARIHEELKKGE